MKKVGIGFGVFIVLTIVIGSIDWKSNAGTDDNRQSSEEIITNPSDEDEDEDQDQDENDSAENGEGLNDIRFADFKDGDWLDNEYIKTLRKYLDDYNSGEIEDEELYQYKEKVKGQFVIANVEPSLWGGLLIQFMFIDHPEYLFNAYVYSTVDVEKRKVVNYSVHYISVRGNEYEMTKQEILDSLKVHPEMKLW